MLRATRLKADVAPKPAAFQDQPRRGCELAEIFAQKPRRFVREKPIAWPRLRFICRRQQLARDIALLVDRKQIFFEAAEKILGLPFLERRANPQPRNWHSLPKRPAGGGELVLQPCFQFCLQIRIKQTSQHIALPLLDACVYSGFTYKNMKPLLTLIAIAFLATIPVDAKTFKLPNEDFAIASIDMPDSWKPKEVENGIWGQSADTAVYMSVVAVGSDKGMNAEIDDTFEMLKTHNVTIDDSTKKENKFKVGSLDATELLFQGKDEDGPCAISICFVPIKDKMIIFTYWVTTAKEKEHLQEVGKIVNSLKPTS
jgi:hypothetical protein